MQITVELDDQKLAEIKRLTGEEQDDRAVLRIVEQMLFARLRRDRLKTLIAEGGIDFPETGRPDWDRAM